MNKQLTYKRPKPAVTAFLVALLAAWLCLSGGAYGHPAQLLDKPLSLNLEEVPLEQALQQISVAAKVKFAYSADQLQLADPVTLHTHQESLGSVLHKLLSPRNIAFKVHEKEATITLRSQPETENKEGSGASHIPAASVRRPPLPVTGTVTDTNRLPLAGVNIIIKGTATGTTTAADGTFTLEANPGDILVFSFIGYTTVEAIAENETPLTIELVEEAQSLNELVVNAGYWEVNQREQTGSISSISAREIEKQPVSNPLQAMQGRMAGVYIQQHSGMPGSNFTIRIRGLNSLSGGNDPLYIVNGVPYPSQSLSHGSTSGGLFGNQGISPLASINPDDIESIEVLKDADATAIYGSRGANGVVLITTKKGAAGKWGVNFNTSAGFSRIGRRMNLLNTQQYLEMRNEAFRNEQAEDFIEQYPEFFPDLAVWPQSRYTDWQQELLGGRAHFTNSHLSFSGGGPLTQVLFSGGYQKQTTIFPGSDYASQASMQIGIVQTSPDLRFRSEINTSYVRNTSHLPGVDLTGIALRLSPNAPALYNSEGGLNWENSTWTNPLAETVRRYRAVTGNLVSNAILSYQLGHGLQLKTSLGFNQLQTDDNSTTPSAYYDPALGRTPADAIVNYNRSATGSWIVEPQASWQKEFSKLNLNLLAGATLQRQQGALFVQRFTGFSSDALLEAFHSAAGQEVVAHNISDYKYTAAYGRANFNWQGKYILNLTGRRDGSSRFGPENRMANFAAAGAAWLFTNEPFAQSLASWLNFGKFHVSYGTSGNDQIGDYAYMDTFNPSGTYQDVSGLYPARLFNPDLAWEINKKMEGGLSLSFLNDRINTMATYYRNRSSSQLITYPLSRITGFSGIQDNFDALVQNTGLEMMLSSINFRKASFTWSTSLNVTLPNNKLVSFPGLEASSYANTYEVGEPLTISKVYELAGVNSQTGIYEFSDLNGDGSVTSADRLRVVRHGQSLFGGLGNTIDYKGLQVSVLLQFVRQRGASYESAFGVPGGGNNIPLELYNSRWQQPADQTTHQLFAATSQAAYDAHFRYTSSNAMNVDASFIRLKNVSLAYQFSNAWHKNLSVKWYLQGQNLATFTSYIGLDPENTSSSRLPPLFTVVSGLQIKL